MSTEEHVSLLRMPQANVADAAAPKFKLVSTGVLVVTTKPF